MKLTTAQKTALLQVRAMWRRGYTREYIKFLALFIIEDYREFCKSKYSIGII